MIQPNKIGERAERIVNSFIAKEYGAFYHYRAAANYCKGVGYEKAAEFFMNEANDELTHAKSLETFLVDWNVIPELPELITPKLEFNSLVEVIESSYMMEFDLYSDYEKGSKEAFSFDICVFNLLQEKVATQNKAVAEYSDMLNKLEGVEPTKTNLLLLEKKLF